MQDIDAILAGRTQKRQLGSRAGNTFSTATFAAEEAQVRGFTCGAKQQSCCLPSRSASWAAAQAAPAALPWLPLRTSIAQQHLLPGCMSSSAGWLSAQQVQPGPTSACAKASVWELLDPAHLHARHARVPAKPTDPSC